MYGVLVAVVWNGVFLCISTVLELTLKIRLVSNPQIPSCLCLQSAKIKGDTGVLLQFRFVCLLWGLYIVFKICFFN